MKKYFLFIFLIIICITSSNVYAECSYTELVEVSSDAAYIEAGYSYAYDDKGAVSGFEITLYNLTEHMYVILNTDEVLPSLKKVNYKGESSNKMITYSDTYLGVYRFQTSNLDKIIKYTFNVYSLSSYTGCTKKVKTLTVIKPKKNEFASLDICKHREVINYFYCKRWATMEFNKTSNEIESIIRKRLKEAQGLTTTAGRATIKEGARLESERRLKWILVSSIVAFVSMLVILVCAIRINSNNRNTI